MTIQEVLDKSEIATAYCSLQKVIGHAADEFYLIEKHTLANQYVFTRKGGHRLYIDCEPVDEVISNRKVK